jgi:hypothetical protein
MKIYRVYRPYHEFDKSGTVEYGYFSTKELALERLNKLYKEFCQKYGSKNITLESNKIIIYEGGFDYSVIKTEEIELDKEIDEDNIGYT